MNRGEGINRLKECQMMVTDVTHCICSGHEDGHTTWNIMHPGNRDIMYPAIYCTYLYWAYP